jgi:hypothetical protein
MNRKDSWRIVALSLLAGFVGGIVSIRFFPIPAFAQDDKIIVAEQFRVKDKNGVTRAFFGLQNEEELNLILKDKNGITGVMLNFNANKGSELYLIDKDETFTYITPGDIFLMYGNSKAYTHLGKLEDGQSTLEFADKNEVTRAKIGLASSGEPMLGFADKSENLRLGFSVMNSQGPLYGCYNEKGEGIWGAP